MKKSIITVIFLSGLSVFAQEKKEKEKENETGTKQETLDAVKNNVLSPNIFLGQITSNPSTNNFGLDLTEQAINLKGAFYSTKQGGFILGANVKGNNENNSLGIFGDGNLNAKLTGDLSATWNIPAIVRYINKDTLNTRIPDYDLIFSDTSSYKITRQRFWFLTISLEGSGAKYNLIDSAASFSEMVQERKYSGWNVYGQFIGLDYYNRKKLALIYSVRISYGETNNVADLTEYTISDYSTFTDGSNGQKFERKVTGYFDEYFVQHQGIISGEINLYNMDTTNFKIGLIAGADFVYNSKQKNFIRFNAGLNFPLELTKSGKTRRLYVGAIISSTDPSNWHQKSDFAFKNTLSASIRLVSPIKINFRD